MPRPRYEEAELTLEDFEAPGTPMSILQIRAEFSIREGWPPEGFDPGEPGELELERVEVMGALVGPHRYEAYPEELAILQKALRQDQEALAWIEAQLEYVS